MDDKGLGGSLVFLVGAPRSGTTHLQRLLASLRGVETAQESHVFEYIAPMVRLWNAHLAGATSDARGGVGLPCYLEEQEFVAAVRRLFWEFLEPTLDTLPGGCLFLEKTPLHALHVDVIDLLLPKARIIHIIRDPRDVVASLLASARSWGHSWAPAEAGLAARLWSRHVRAARRAGGALDGRRYTEVRYERLLHNAVPELLRLGTFLGCTWSVEELNGAVERNRIDYARDNAPTPIPRRGAAAKRSGKVVNEPNGFMRKGMSGSWKTDLSLLEKAKVWRATRKMMKELGYTWRCGSA